MSKKLNLVKFWNFKGSPSVKPYFGCHIMLLDFTILWVNWSFYDKYAHNITIFSGRPFGAFFSWDSAHVSKLREYCKWMSPLQSVLWMSFTGFQKGSSVCQQIGR